MAGRRSFIIAGAGGGLAVALAIFAALSSGGRTAALDSLAHALDEQVREVGAAVQARTETLAQLPRLAWAVATDEQTVLDLTSDELAFRPQPGESIEIGQVMTDGRVQRLLRLGVKEIVHLPFAPPGRRLLVSGDRLVMVMVASVEPRTRQKELRGAVALSRPIDLAPLRERLIAAGAAARLMVGESVIELGTPRDHARAVPEPLTSEPELKLTFLVPGSGWTSAILYLLALLVAAATAAAAFVLRRRENASSDLPLTALVPESRD